ncbi:HAMP domain-containing sensor histidine kinase [Niabella yanshanensis]|uniref:histidine kinase n=1 Tax=Niabella yanshanensis TaxID=577386 RepID=A0ABZ0W625_9BACT|nr:HAMP domain-containing sensor histidine kinase [Niabella yanshanensis]WQD38692.1 HAMP domain-containing sensor histidine kinase [Niabella yanshanensis]
MKLITKLTLFTTISKAVIVLLFVWLLPSMVEGVASDYTNYLLKQQEKKVFVTIQENGIDYYLEGDSSYGSYTMLKEEYISLEQNNHLTMPDTLLTSKRMIEGDTLTYRLLVRNFEYDGKSYILEIGKALASINQYDKPLQRIALSVLLILVLLTLITDLGFTHVVLRPLKRIIRSKLYSPKFPYNEKLEPVATSTSDFSYLDEALINLMHRITADFERERAFTSNASHELMTPMGILQNKMENIMLSTEDRDVLEKVSVMMKTLGRLKKIVNSLLLISRIENNQYARQDTIALAPMISEMMKELEPLMEEKGIRYTTYIPNDIIVKSASKDLLFQLLYNLLTNAIRYNRTGGSIEISGNYSPEEKYVIIIRDTGIGIEAGELPYIFDRFKKTSSSCSSSNGLGLSIVKSIADFHGIEIKVSSVRHHGSSFFVGFPQMMVNLQ